jgi:hypothetical protein
MFDQFVGNAIAATPGLTGIGYEAVDEHSVRLVMEAPELGRRISIEVGQAVDDGIAVVRLHTTRTVEGELEPPGEVVQQGLAELRRRWPEIVIQIRNTREGVHLEYETRILRRGASIEPFDAELTEDFVAVLPRLRDCLVRSFHFINVLCLAAQVDVRLLEGRQDFALEEWEFIQECGGLESVRQAMEELSTLLDVGLDEVLPAAIATLRAARVTQIDAASGPITGIVPVGPEAVTTIQQPLTGVASVVSEPVGLTLEELIRFGP